MEIIENMAYQNKTELCVVRKTEITDCRSVDYPGETHLSFAKDI